MTSTPHPFSLPRYAARVAALVGLCAWLGALPVRAQEGNRGFDGLPPQSRYPVAWGTGRPELVRVLGPPDARASLTVYIYDSGDGQAAFSFHHGGVESVAEIFSAPTRDTLAVRLEYDTYARAIAQHYGVPVSRDVPISGTLGTTNIRTVWRPVEGRADGIHLVELTLKAVPVDEPAGSPPHYVVVVRYVGPEPLHVDD